MQRPSSSLNPGQQQQHQRQFKIVLLGEAAVGKSSIVLRFAKRQFREQQAPTIGAAFHTQTLVIDGTTVRLEIWDTAGQERYHALAPMYYRGAQAALVVYDVTCTESYDRALNWVRELQRSAANTSTIALVANKIDLLQQSDQTYVEAVDQENASSYANQNGLLFALTSAKTGQGVSELFYNIAMHLLPQEATQVDGLNLHNDSPKEKSCCG